MRTIAVMLAAVVVVAFAHGQALGADPGPIVLGLILDGADRSPISDAAVSVIGDRAMSDVRSDASGRFSIQLRPQTQEGDVVWVRVSKDEYTILQDRIVVSTKQPIVLQLKRGIEHSASPKVVSVTQLKNAGKDDFSVELLISNPSKSAPIFANQVQWEAKAEVEARGYTGFVNSAAYDVTLDYKGGGKIAGGSKSDPKNPYSYPVVGRYDFGIDTRERAAKFWECTLVIPIRVRIDPGDQVSIVLTFSKPSLKLVKEVNEGEMIAYTTLGLRSEIGVARVLTSDNQTGEATFNPKDFLVWFTSKPKQKS